MRYFGLLLMVGGLIMLMLGEIIIVYEERVAHLDVEKAEPIVWTIYMGIAAIIAGLVFVISGKKKSFSLNTRRPFSDPILNI